jgi:hypothetical protein
MHLKLGVHRKERAIPENVAIKYKELKYILHPDKFLDPALKKKA